MKSSPFALSFLLTSVSVVSDVCVNGVEEAAAELSQVVETLN